MGELTDALAAADVDAEEARRFAEFLASPQHAFSVLPLEEQKDRSHEAAVQAAQRFVRHPDEYLREGEPDPLRAFYGLGHLAHTRDLPTFALHVLSADVLDPGTRRDLTVFAWMTPEWPQQGLNTELWHEAWARAGFCSDHEDVTRPAGPVTVWRGAVPKFKRGMSWTDDRDRAVWFARRWSKANGGPFRDARLYEATPGPERLYARILGRNESEWVVDTRGLPIRTVEP